MKDSFKVIEIAEDQPEVPETLGTKEKFWIRHDGSRKLLKFGREGTGEDWAEKVACELAELLGVPHAHYDLARCRGRTCVLSTTIVPEDGRLILGNEIIASVGREYDGARAYHQREHTVSRVLAALRVHATSPVAETWHQFLGYLLLDAWIGNTDRHHENWALIIRKDREVELAPTFDHASSMGRELTDADRVRRLRTSDARIAPAAFAKKARSALYEDPGDKRPLSPIEAFRSAARAQRRSGFYWLERISSISDAQVSGILERIPASFITPEAREFAFAVLGANKAALLQMIERDK